jgi:HoxN/HupN/NixA family high-affinity nickel-transporter
MSAVVIGLHVVGFFLLIAVVAPHHYAPGSSGAFTIGLGLTAYTLGLRHAFDADHISAIDNTTRKLMGERKRPLGVGFFFSLGHSTIVFVLALLFAVGIRALSGPVRNGHSALHSVTNLIGTGVSVGFLYVIAVLNLIVLVEILRVSRDMRGGHYDEAGLERQLNNRGLMNRFYGRFTKMIGTSWHVYPLGMLFGLGFDTATEVALLFLAAGAAGAGLPFYAILCLPILFAAGMSLFDTIDGSFMNFRLRLGVLQAGPQGLLQHHDHRSVGGGRADRRDDRAARTGGGRAQAPRRVLGLRRADQHQHDRLRDRRSVRRHLGGRAAGEALCPHRGALGGEAEQLALAGSPSTRSQAGHSSLRWQRDGGRLTHPGTPGLRDRAGGADRRGRRPRRRPGRRRPGRRNRPGRAHGDRRRRAPARDGDPQAKGPGRTGGVRASRVDAGLAVVPPLSHPVTVRGPVRGDAGARRRGPR